MRAVNCTGSTGAAARLGVLGRRYLALGRVGGGSGWVGGLRRLVLIGMDSIFDTNFQFQSTRLKLVSNLCGNLYITFLLIMRGAFHLWRKIN